MKDDEEKKIEIDDSLEYKVSKEEIREIRASKSKTLPNVIIWMLYVIGCVVMRYFFRDVMYNLEYVVICAGAASFTYMGLEYSNAFIKNAALESGSGKLDNIGRYQWIVMFWVLTSILFTIMYFVFGMEDLPHKDTMVIAGTLTTEYIAGNKANSIATTIDGKKKGKTNE